MNERIKELAEQAKEHANHLDSIGVDASMEDIFNQKFAQLIVAECMQQVEEQYKPVLEDEIMMKDTHWDGYVQCGVDSYVAIREHFGDEE
jgi:hypothetical protein